MKNTKESLKKMKGENMRKNVFKMMLVAGVAALIIPGAAMAEWDQSELQKNQADHDAMINLSTVTPGDFAYGDESPIGYDTFGDGTADLTTDNPFALSGRAPWNTTPCPIQLYDLLDTTPTWEESMGNCPAQISPLLYIGQTNAGWKEGDNEQFGPILDDLYQSLTETASTESNEYGDQAFKKVDQVLDILFYKGNTVGDVYGVDGWTEEGGGKKWLGALGIDQTLDQDVADISGTTGNNLGPAHGTWLWNFDHVAQTFYQDFRLFDLGNTFGGIGATYLTGGLPTLDLAGATKPQKSDYNPRTRHGIELLAICAATGACTYETEGIWGVKTLDTEDFAFFDQWVIQSLRDTYTQSYDGNGTAPGVLAFTGSVALNQSYSSWMALGVPGQVCNNVNDTVVTDGTCSYVYEKAGHAVNKSITPVQNNHQTGDP
ncbi:MAG: hypothetical protein A2Z47_11715 [Thermodesulfovibrio sp. RBG_19FT_COMBO_42_12]|nr:MAG: hypothetical protein A2Z47_11715 [Thermodesulfovibrio sp. RBG_19FT_COMBO_42_12]